MPRDPLTEALSAFSASISGQKTGRVLIRTRRRIAEFCKVSEITINTWRKEEWWPGSRSGHMEVWSDELDTALRSAGIEGIQARQTALPVDRGQAKKELESVVDMDKLALEPEDDLVSARAATRQLQSVVRAWKMESLANPTTARLFAQFTEALSRQTQRMTSLQQSMLDLQVRRRELLSVEEACSIYDEFIQTILSRIDDLNLAFGDVVKDLELETYKTSQIDSEAMADMTGQVLLNFRDLIADDLAKTTGLILKPSGVG